MMADFRGGKTGSSSSQSTVSDHNAGPIIEESQKSEEYQQDLQVVLGTAFGVVAMVGILALVFLLCRIYKARHSPVSNNHNDDHEVFERDITVDVEGKSQPVVLLLYAYDCLIHEKVVAALASFLMEACGVTVTYDLLEENEIVERGVDDWLVDRLQEVDYILVLCSLGARLRCSKKRVRFKSDSQRALPDYFAVAVDYVAEKMRAEKHKGLSLNKFVTAYMEYSTRSDIPPQLDLAVQFCLMKDIHKLHLHLNTYGPDLDKSDTASQSSMCENHYHETETGAVLKATIEQARAFFRENPCWMDDQIDQPSIAGPAARAQKYKHKSLKQPLLALIGAPPVLEYSLLSQCQDKCPRTDGAPGTTETFQTLGRGQENSSIFHGRQNSLPSSLASSHVGVSSAQQTLSRSMNSFATDQPDCDGLPCLYCNSVHMDNRWECRHIRNQTSRNVAVKPSQVSLQDPLYSLDTNRSPTTVLQAEVHQEWGLSNRGTPEKKSATFGGDIRSWISDNDVFMGVAHFQSLPPHHPYKPSPFTMTEWNSHIGADPGRSGCPEDHKLNRSLSSLSLSTLDSYSVSDGDSLERDLRSIQNISSFQDFFNCSSFTSGMLAPKIVTAPANSGTEMIHILPPHESLSSRMKSANTNIV